MRIISLNAWGGAMYDELADWLSGVDADVLCLQEVCRVPGLRGWTRFEDDARSLPQRADLVADLAELLPTHEPWFAVSDSGPVMDEQGVLHQQHFGLAMFTRTDLVRVASRAAFVHGSYRAHPGSWPVSDRPRAAQVARLHDPRDGSFVTVGHLHGLRDAAGKADSSARHAQSRRLVELVESVRETDDRTVVCGDLNVLPDSETFDILAGIGLTDLVRDADTRTSRYRKSVRHASYLVVDDPARIRQFDVLDSPEVSDHRPLLVDL